MRNLKTWIESAKKIRPRTYLELWSYILLLMIFTAVVLAIVYKTKL